MHVFGICQIQIETNITYIVISDIFIGERIPLIVFGSAKVKHIKISAMLSGLKLEANLQNVHASATHKERVKGKESATKDTI
mgnify:CR=1 FL=1